jgi:hypothetical protein
MKHPSLALHPTLNGSMIRKTKECLKTNMAKFLWTICGFSAATLGFLAWSRKRPAPVELLAHRLEEAWADHHTIV